MTVPTIPIPLLALILLALTAGAFFVVAALRDSDETPGVQDFVCRVEARGGRWRWRITEAGDDTIADRVPFAWGTEETQEAAMRAGHDSFVRWANSRPNPDAFQLLFAGEGVEITWV